MESGILGQGLALGDNPFKGCQVFIGDTPIVTPKRFKLETAPEPPKAHWGGNVSFDISAECAMTSDNIVDALLKQAINDAIDQAYQVGINIAPTRLPRKAKKWYSRQTKRNQHGMTRYLHILRHNHKELGECTVSHIKRKMEGIDIELTGRPY